LSLSKRSKKAVPRVLNFKIERDLLWINVLGIALIVVVSLFSASFVRILLGVPLILFFPGYTLVCALFPKNPELDGTERVALSIGLSIAVVPLLALLLNYTPFGIRLCPVLVSLFAFTFLMSVAAVYRRKRLNVGDRFVPSFSVNVPRWGKMKRTDKALSAGLIASVVVCGAFVSYFVSAPRVGERFTEFYVLGPGGKAESYPTNLTLGENGTVILGVVNHEYGEVNYNIAIRLDNETIRTLEDIQLLHEGKWEQDYTFVPQNAGEKMKLEFVLFREGLDDPYRSLHLWISVKSQEVEA
jgi:uncharacterized membrane protein